jgi:Protein of unknown function (DUF1573)
MRKVGCLIMALLALSVVAGCKGQESEPAKATQEVVASRSDGNASPQVAPVSSDSQAGVPDAGKPRIVFDQKEFDFGKVEAGEDVDHVFAFRNAGEGTLRIDKVSSG